MIENIEIKDGEIHGEMIVRIPFKIKPKKKGSYMMGLAGHDEFRDDDKKIATAWPQRNGCRIYINSKDDVVVHYDSDKCLEVEQLRELEKIIEKHNKEIQPC